MTLVAQFAETGRQAAFKLLSTTVTAEQSYAVRNLPYGSEPRQQLDLYLPYDWHSPVGVIFIHGGTWQTGDKAEYGFAGLSFARRGLPTAVINYRRYPAVKFPTFIEDATLALRWLQQQGGHYGFKAKHWLLVGHSAGAHIASLLSLDRRYAEQAGIALDQVLGVVCLAGVYSMRPEKDPLFADLFSDCADNQYHAMKPINFLRKDGVPLLMFHGRKDTLVACRSAERMFKNALLTGHPATLRVNEAHGHFQPLLDLLPWRAGHTRVMDDIERFIRMYTE